MLLRSIAESANGAEALTLPIIRAVSGCLYDRWTDRGLEWLEAMDAVPLLGIFQTLSDLGLQDRLEDAIQIQTDADPRLAVRTADQKASKEDGEAADGVPAGVGRSYRNAKSRSAAPSEDPSAANGGLANGQTKRPLEGGLCPPQSGQLSRSHHSERPT